VPEPVLMIVQLKEEFDPRSFERFEIGIQSFFLHQFSSLIS